MAEFLKHLVSPTFRKGERILTKIVTRKLKKGDRVTLNTHEHLKGGKLTYHSAEVVDITPYGIVIGPHCMVTSRADWHMPIAVGDMSPGRKHTTGMAYTTRNVFIPTRNLSQRPTIK